MSCGKSYNDSCVCDKVRKIADAQDTVDQNCCDSGSCHRAIQDLVSPTGGNGADTVPFMLLCGCDNTFAGLLPYFGWGIYKYSDGCSGPIPSPFFRVKKFVDGKRCCAILELLYPELCGSIFKYENFYRTGVCIEVDLSKFTGITCFHPVAALNANDDTVAAGLETVQQLKSDPSMMGAISSAE
ncbi:MULTISPECIES: CotY/CotZ family spore coat protein [Pontibacillus]|uniref:CotY/CotZ family spore coat protein n=1 Tax=Pontibacillus chungwhensis TaxID=265426 RepID=A0ABY8V2R6_9BACI|nr:MULTISPECIES: CotY/CotZ family spore coat protein [Pontibacillus]MCD5322259.1 spore coat protein [Pontibacillus sp. HN14]WIF99552.1 CotY/CotZ family spore coat protein [Pontibacillus chungwhensis]